MTRRKLERTVKFERRGEEPYPGHQGRPFGAPPASRVAGPLARGRTRCASAPFQAGHAATPPIGHAREPSGDPPPRPRLAFLLLGAIQVVLIAAITLVVAALPAVQADFGVGRGELALVTSGYGLAFGGLLLLGGRLADWLGRRRVFVWGVVVFGAASVTAAVAPGFALLAAARFAQGCGAALAAPAALALVPAVYPDPAARARALAVWGGLSGGGAAGGMLLSGVLVTWFSWRWAFGIPALIAALVALAGPRLLPRDRGPAGRVGSPDSDASGEAPSPALDGGVDVAGGLLAASGLTALGYGLFATEAHGWLTSAVLVPLLAAAVLLSAFVWVESRASAPLLPLSFLASRRRAAALLAILLASAGMASSAFFLALYLQQVRGLSPLHTSAAFLPYVLVPLAGTVAGRLLSRIGAAGLCGLGLGAAGVGLGLLARLSPDLAYAPLLLAGLVIFAIGAGHAFSGATVAALEDAPAHRAGLAGGVVNTAMEVGPAVGLALLLSLAALRTARLSAEGHDVASAVTGGYAFALGTAAVAFLLAAVLCAFALRRGSSRTMD